MMNEHCVHSYLNEMCLDLILMLKGLRTIEDIGQMIVANEFDFGFGPTVRLFHGLGLQNNVRMIGVNESLKKKKLMILEVEQEQTWEG